MSTKWLVEAKRREGQCVRLETVHRKTARHKMGAINCMRGRDGERGGVQQLHPLRQWQGDVQLSAIAAADAAAAGGS